MNYRETNGILSDKESESDEDVCWKRKICIPRKNNSKSLKINRCWKIVSDEFGLTRMTSGISDLDGNSSIGCGFQMLDDPNVKKKSGFDINDLDYTDWNQSVSRSHLRVNFDSPSDIVADEIIRLLDEENEGIIRKAVDVLGVQIALEFYYLTEDIENNGGIILLDGSRRRSPGGVYLNLIKNSNLVEKEKKKKIFFIDKLLKDRLKRMRRKKRKRNQQATKREYPNSNKTDSKHSDTALSDADECHPTAKKIQKTLEHQELSENEIEDGELCSNDDSASCSESSV